MMKKLFFGLACLCASLYSNEAPIPGNHQLNEKEAVRCVRDIIARASKTLGKRHHMRPIGTVVGMPQFVVHKLGVHFDVRMPMSQEQLRPILVDCINELLSLVNSSDCLKPYLFHYPFTPDNIDIAIFIEDRNGGQPRYPNINLAENRGSELIYSARNPEKDAYFVEVGRESFEAAEEIVRGR